MCSMRTWSKQGERESLEQGEVETNGICSNKPKRAQNVKRKPNHGLLVGNGRHYLCCLSECVNNSAYFLLGVSL